MAEPSRQTFKNHARYVPLYHYVLFAIVVTVVVWYGRRMFQQFSAHALHDFLLVVALLLVAVFARAFALTVQDRVIRLEMRLRMQALAPQQLPRFDELTRAQFTALRFASDAELPGLTQQVLEGGLRDGADIKRKIQHWKADDLRV